MRALALLAFVLLGALARPASAVTYEQANRDQRRAAQKTFEAADGLYRAKRFDEALTAFKASYDLVASANTRLMIGRCLLALERPLEARAELLGTIADAEAGGDRYEKAREAARAELGALNEKLSFVTIAVTGDASVRLDDRELAREELGVALPLLPAPIVIEAIWPSGRTARKELELSPGSYESVALDEPAPPPAPPPKRAAPPPPPPPAPERSPAPRTLAYVAGGIGVAGLATFAIFGLMNNSTYSSLQEECPTGRCPPDRADDIDHGRTYQTLANVGLAVGVIGLGTGATLFVLSSGSGSESVSARLSPSSVTVSGKF